MSGSVAWKMGFEGLRPADVHNAIPISEFATMEQRSRIWSAYERGYTQRVAPKRYIPAGTHGLLAEREDARKTKDFARADAIRAEIRRLGLLVEDSPTGPRLRWID